MIKLLLYILLTPQADLPFVDALPLDYPNKDDIICECRGLGRLMPNQGTDYASDREGTRVLLANMLMAGKTADECWYLLGRLQGRHYLWQCVPSQFPGCSPSWRYIDVGR